MLVAGVGGLGATVAQLLARAGVGRLYLVDEGRVDWPDLNRQTLYGEGDVGRAKIDVAVARLAAINSKVEVIPLSGRIDEAFVFPAGVEVVVDCLDNWPSRFSLHRSFAGRGLVRPRRCARGSRGRCSPPQGRHLPAAGAVFAGLAQASEPLPVTPDGAAIIAGTDDQRDFRPARRRTETSRPHSGGGAGGFTGRFWRFEKGEAKGRSCLGAACPRRIHHVPLFLLATDSESPIIDTLFYLSGNPIRWFSHFFQGESLCAQ